MKNRMLGETNAIFDDKYDFYDKKKKSPQKMEKQMWKKQQF